MHLGGDRDDDRDDPGQDQNDTGQSGRAARRLTNVVGGGAHPACGQDMTTLNSATRWNSYPQYVRLFRCDCPRVGRSRSLIFRG